MRQISDKIRCLEICVEDEAGARAAVQGGAERLELCCALDCGGLTPSFGLMRALAGTAIPVVALIRPRSGDFRYTVSEKAMIADDIKAAAACGMAGVVLGAMSGPQQLDLDFLAEMVALTHAAFAPRSPLLTLHRVVDMLEKPEDAVPLAVSLGFQRILTSGGHSGAVEGRDTLRRMVNRASGRVAIMVGGGIRPDNVSALVSDTGVHEIHASAREPVEVDHRLRNLGFVTSDRRVTSEKTVLALRQALS